MGDVLDPDLPIVDPHHHLWPPGGAMAYGLDDLLVDVGSGHNVVATVFVQCGAAYDRDAVAELAPVGETRFVAQAAEASGGLIAGIVAHTDLRSPRLDEVLDRHEEAAGGRLVGIRDALARAVDPAALMFPGRAPAGLAADPEFRAGVRRLGECGLTYESWHYHYQNRELLDLARAVPETTIVLDHFGTPLGVGPYAAQREEIFEAWSTDIADLAACANVAVKLGGMAMPDNGFGWSIEDPPSVEEFIGAQQRYYRHAIERFGPERCMFESNFPVDRLSLPYDTLWNAFKTMTVEFSSDERAELFAGTAQRVYGLDLAPVR